jgi:hypothetical protein
VPSWGRYAADSLLIETLDTGFVTATAIAAAPFTVPVGQKWLLLSAILRYSASANVGNRLPAWQVRDAADVVILGVSSSLALTASQHINIFFQSLLPRDIGNWGNTGGLLSTNMIFHGPLELKAGEDVRFLDGANIDGAGDSARGLVVIQRLVPFTF